MLVRTNFRCDIAHSVCTAECEDTAQLGTCCFEHKNIVHVTGEQTSSCSRRPSMLRSSVTHSVRTSVRIQAVELHTSARAEHACARLRVSIWGLEQLAVRTKLLAFYIIYDMYIYIIIECADVHGPPKL